jgi:hypothetical protein
MDKWRGDAVMAVVFNIIPEGVILAAAFSGMANPQRVIIWSEQRQNFVTVDATFRREVTIGADR